MVLVRFQDKHLVIGRTRTDVQRVTGWERAGVTMLGRTRDLYDPVLWLGSVSASGRDVGRVITDNRSKCGMLEHS